MTTHDNYVWEIKEWTAAVNDVIRKDRALTGAGHRDEDRLLERYVRDRAFEGDMRASELVRLMDTQRRRWYA